MRRRKISNQIERQLLIALIVSKDFLAQSASIIEAEKEVLRDDPLFKQISTWCIDYWNEYKKAPKAAIEAIYHTWADKNGEDPAADDIHDLLEEVSGQYEEDPELNVAFLLDSLGELLTKRKLQHVQEQIEAHLARGDIKTAGTFITEYRKPKSGKSEAVDPINDEKAWKRAFAKAAEPVIHFPGAAGRFLNRSLVRDGFIAVQAPDKVGKSYWLMEFAFRALQERRKVAMFQCGDLSEPQMMKRIAVRLAGVPEDSSDCKKVLIPMSMQRDEDEEIGVKVDYDKVKFKSAITPGIVKLARKRFNRICGLPSKEAFFKLSTHAMDTVNFSDISGILDQWAYEESFIPDVIIVDYADILAAEEVKKEGRDMINDTWKAGRRISQERHALLIVATQASALAYDGKTQNRRHFSNDKRKLAHVTGMIGLNQTEEEKEAQVMRLNWIVNRSAPFLTKRCLYVGNCLSLARAMCCATL